MYDTPNETTRQKIRERIRELEKELLDKKGNSKVTFGLIQEN